MKAVAGEAELAAVARMLIGEGASRDASEDRLVGKDIQPDLGTVETMRALIATGKDPLGETFCRLRGNVERRRLGAIYTPDTIVGGMMQWAARQGNEPARIVDPGSGSGRFILAAAARFPNAELIAVDIDPLAMLILRGNAAVRGMALRITVYWDD